MPSKQSNISQTNWKQQARQELGCYYLAIYEHYEVVDYQQEDIIPHLEALARDEFDRLMLFMPPGHAKTDIATKTFIPWYLSNHPGHNAILITHTDPLARDFGSSIRDTMQTGVRHAQVFPEVKVNSNNKAATFFKTTQGNYFYAFGMDGGVTGRRADLLVIDDPIKNLEDALSESVQNNLHNIYKGVLKDRLRPNAKILVCMTRWATRDFAARILEEEGGRWQVLALPAQTHKEGCPGTECDCPYLWESYYGRKHYEDNKNDQYIWQAKWQQVPRPALNQGFSEEWLRFYLPMGAQPEYRTQGDGVSPPLLVAAPIDHHKLWKFNTYIFVDPAMGKEAAHDRTCILVISAGPGGRLFLVDAVLDRLNPGERIDHLVRLARKWKPKQIVYEEYALVADTYFLNLVLKEQGITDLIVTSVGRKAGNFSGGRLKKHDRIIQLVPDFRDGRIWLPKRMVNTLQDGSKFDVINYFINREYLPYAGEGSVAHDDMLDCMARIRDPEVFFEHRERPDEDELSDEHWAGEEGSWESRW